MFELRYGKEEDLGGIYRFYVWDYYPIIHGRIEAGVIVRSYIVAIFS